MRASWAIFMVFIGCMSNVFFLELVIKEDPGAGHLITFFQFLFIALHGLIFTSKFGIVRRNIPLKGYIALVIVFTLTNICNNYVFHFNIPVPLHIIFRSGSLITNMIMGVIILKKSYPKLKYFSVILITLGIILCTMASANDVKSTPKNADTATIPKNTDTATIPKNADTTNTPGNSDTTNTPGNSDTTNTPGNSDATTPYEDFFWWCVGICLLTFALFLSASTGIYQELLFQKHGKHPKEVIYYIHMLPLPLFLFASQSISEHVTLALESEVLNIFNLIHVPKLFLFVLFNVLTQAFCVSSVINLTSECSSLVVTLVLTLRKFASLLFSIWYFENAFTLTHWIGTVFVFIGTVLFTEIHKKIYNAFTNEKLKSKTD